jgi:hypothetical protein
MQEEEEEEEVGGGVRSVGKARAWKRRMSGLAVHLRFIFMKKNIK